VSVVGASFVAVTVGSVSVTVAAEGVALLLPAVSSAVAPPQARASRLAAIAIMVAGL
jgi:hypothetical protein